MKVKQFLGILAVMFFILGVTGCATDANIASENLSVAADNFEINRRIVFVNGFTGEYMLVIEGLCSISVDGLDGQLEVVCKTGVDEYGVGKYKKHFLGLSETVSYVVEQLDDAPADVYHYRVIFKPESVIPSMSLNTSTP